MVKLHSCFLFYFRKRHYNYLKLNIYLINKLKMTVFVMMS